MSPVRRVTILAYFLVAKLLLMAHWFWAIHFKTTNRQSFNNLIQTRDKLLQEKKDAKRQQRELQTQVQVQTITTEIKQIAQEVGMA